MTISFHLAPRLAALALVGALAAPTTGFAGQNAIKIGVMADYSGFAAEVGGKGAEIAARMAVADFGGKANGKPVEIVAGDMQNKPDVAGSLARQWFDVDGVDTIVDLPVSSVALAVQSIARDKKKVLLISAAATTELTNAQCSPYTIHWADDTYALSVGTAKAVVDSGGKTWFFLTADFAFGYAMEKAASDVIAANGGKVLGSVRHPTGTTDYSSFLLQAQASKAQVVGLANVSADTINSIKQAAEFGLMSGGQNMAGFILFVTDIHSLGLKTAQGLYVTENYYWDDSDGTRAFAKRYMAQMGKMPSKEQANTYAAVLHYLKAVDAAKSDDAATVVAKMKELPVDQFGKKASIRADGRVLYDLALYQVKKPEESKYDWDYYKLVKRLTPKEAFMPIEKSTCPSLKKG